MRKLQYSPKESIDAPWLLSSKSLRELDSIITEYWGKFESRREKQLRNDINKFKKTFTKAEKELAQISEAYSKELKDRISEDSARFFL